MSDLTAAQKDRLVADLKMLIADAEEFLKGSVGDASAEAVEAKGRIQARLRQAQDQLHRLQDTVTAKARAAGEAADDYVHDHPWKAVGAAAGVGLIIGLLIGRR